MLLHFFFLKAFIVCDKIFWTPCCNRGYNRQVILVICTVLILRKNFVSRVGYQFGICFCPINKLPLFFFRVLFDLVIKNRL